MINTAQRDTSQRRHIHRMRLHPYEAITKSTLPTQAARRMGTGSLSAFPYSTKGVGEPKRHEHRAVLFGKAVRDGRHPRSSSQVYKEL